MFIFRLIGIQLGNFFMLFLQFQIAFFCFSNFPFLDIHKNSEKRETEKTRQGKISLGMMKNPKNYFCSLNFFLLQNLKLFRPLRTN